MNAKEKYEFSYWKRKGIKKGTRRYRSTLKYFFSNGYDHINNKVIADVGCGPFVGVLPFFNKSNTLLAVDPLASKYKKLVNQKIKIIQGFGENLKIKSNFCDMVFCINAIDHSNDPKKFALELCRVLKSGGRLFIHLHIKHPTLKRDIGHPFAISEAEVRSGLFKKLTVEDIKVMDYDPIDNKKRVTLIGTFVKKEIKNGNNKKHI